MNIYGEIRAGSDGVHAPVTKQLPPGGVVAADTECLEFGGPGSGGPGFLTRRVKKRERGKTERKVGEYVGGRM